MIAGEYLHLELPRTSCYPYHHLVKEKRMAEECVQRERPRYLFFLMFSIVLLLSVNFTILRSVRSTLAVVDLGTGANTIPLFELFGALPGSILMTWGLSWLMNRISIQKVFLVTMALFLGFFLVFALGLYPSLVALRQKGEIGGGLLQICSMLFYVMGELWKPALAIILFWGLVNQYTPLADAKKLYAPLMLGGSIGAILAGPLVSLCTSETLWRWFSLSSERWTHALGLMMFAISILGVLTALLYHRLWSYFTSYAQESTTASSVREHFSLKESLSLCIQNPQLRLLSWIVIADYIAYSLGEVIFLDLLKHKFPAACDYCNYMGTLSSWSGLLTVISALFITPFILRRCQWVVAAIATPLSLLIIGGIFFLLLSGKTMSLTLFGWHEERWLAAVVLFGSLLYCLCRAAKYTLFDTSKELAFILMPAFQKMRGKLVVDGICSRLGRGSAAALSLSLIHLFGGVLASSFLTGVIASGIALSCVFTTSKLGRLLSGDALKNS